MRLITPPVNTEIYLGMLPYGPNGFVSEADEKAQAYKLINPYLVNEHWRNVLCFKDKGDEYYGGSSYAYIPTNFQLISALELVNRSNINEAPYHTNEPSMNNLLQGIYGSISTLWNNIRKATGTEQW